MDTKNYREKLNDILLNDTYEENLEFLISIIPEIKDIIGFKHNHPHHHLDVWGHTLLALRNVTTNDLEIKMALLLHDIGKPHSYQDEEIRHFYGHPEVSERMARKILERLEYDSDFIKDVCYLIKYHDTLIDPDNLDNTYELVVKRLLVQYADAKAHSPDKVAKKVDKLDKVKEKLICK